MSEPDKADAVRKYARSLITHKYKTASALASALGISGAAVSELLSGRRGAGLRTVVSLAALGGDTTEAVLEGGEPACVREAKGISHALREFLSAHQIPADATQLAKRSKIPIEKARALLNDGVVDLETVGSLARSLDTRIWRKREVYWCESELGNTEILLREKYRDWWEEDSRKLIAPLDVIQEDPFLDQYQSWAEFNLLKHAARLQQKLIRNREAITREDIERLVSEAMHADPVIRFIIELRETSDVSKLPLLLLAIQQKHSPHKPPPRDST